MIHPGQVWLDTAGQPIQSHSGGVFRDGDFFYWYGTNWDGPTIPPGTLPVQGFTWFFNRGVTIYRSKDLIGWELLGVIMNEVGYQPGNLLQPLNVLFRPKIIKSHRTGKFIFMAALVAPDFNSANDVIVAESDLPAGPYRLYGRLAWRGEPNLTSLWTQHWSDAAGDPPTRIRGFDINLFQDNDGKAWLLVGRFETYLYELSEDCLSVVRVEKMEGIEGEAPCLFRAGDTYFVMASLVTGWAPNRNRYWSSPSLHGPWTPHGPFATGPREETTFDSQVANVLRIGLKNEVFIFISDRFGAVTDNEVPDLRQATHVWLPIEIDLKTSSLRVPWKESWNVSA